MRAPSLLSVLASASLAMAEPIRPRSTIVFKGPFEVEQGGLRNINVEFLHPHDGELAIGYGDCGIFARDDLHHLVGRTHVGSHKLAARHADYEGNRPDKFVWVVPTDVTTGGCLHAFVDGAHVGKSEAFEVLDRQQLRKRGTFADNTDAQGAWFDGVEYIKQKQADDVFVSAFKNKSFGIVAGMSGLHTGLLLDSVNITNWHIIESTSRIGGRVRTKYLNGTAPEDHQYQEMGPMRFPYELTDSTTNETFPVLDMRMVFQLIDHLNTVNAANTSAQVELINWVQSSPNLPVATSKRRPDGTVPGKTEVADHPELYADAATAHFNQSMYDIAEAKLEEFNGLTPEAIRKYAANVFTAHRAAVDHGDLDFSEVEFLRQIVGADRNTTDEMTATDYRGPMWEYEDVYFMASAWKTIDGGLNKIPEAFWSVVKDRVSLDTKVSGIRYAEEEGGALYVSHHPTGVADERKLVTEETRFDYIFNSVPINMLRFWKLPKYSSLMKRAIDHYGFSGAAKVAIQYSQRFWEQQEFPIFGGCGRVDVDGIGQVCYPSVGFNTSGPGVVLASYISGTDAIAACAQPAAEHIAWVQAAMVEIHGKVADDSWTGNWERQCWNNDEHHGGAWASPLSSQQPLFLEAFWQTEFNTVFIGEHTAHTHAWIFSALEAATRGVVQLLLDMGLVDEAKQVNKDWMARWISV